MIPTDEIKSILEASTKRAEAATKPPFALVKSLFGDVVKISTLCGDVARMDLDPETGTAEANANFFGEARTELPARDAALMVAVDALADFASGLSGPYKVDRAEHAEAVIGATEARCEELLASILAILKGEK